MSPVGLTVRPLTAAIGAEVTGVRLDEELDDATVGEIRRALLDHLVLFFRDQSMTAAQQLAFAGRFGPIMMAAIDTGSPEPPGITVIDQVAPKGLNADRWHADSTHLPEPPMAAVLRAVQLPEVGGDTCWASMYAAYETLSPSMQCFLDPLTAEHSSTFIDTALERTANVVRRDNERVPSHHPVVRVHPETGRRLLFVNENWTDRIDGLSAAESDYLLRFLTQHIHAPEFAVRFHWEPGSVAFWDERSTQHFAVPDYTERRVMHRCLLQGDRPVGPTSRSSAG